MFSILVSSVITTARITSMCGSQTQTKKNWVCMDLFCKVSSKFFHDKFGIMYCMNETGKMCMLEPGVDTLRFLQGFKWSIRG